MSSARRSPVWTLYGVTGGGERWRSAGSDGDARRSTGIRPGRLARSRRTTAGSPDGSSRSPTRASRPRRRSASAWRRSTGASCRRSRPPRPSGARLIPVGELERYLAERREEPRTQRWRAARSGRRPALPPELVARIRREHARGASLAEIARRLNRDDIPTGQGARQWWPSTVRAVLLRSSPPRSARAAGA
ncbi:MAG: recombinase family protein [Gaiellaceae bacterium]